MGSVAHRHEGQVVEVLFDADQYLSPADWAEPIHEPSRVSPDFLNISLPSSRRCSTSSSFSCTSSIQLSPTLSPSPVTCAWAAALKTSPRPTSNFRPGARGLDAAALFLAGVPGAEQAVRNARTFAITQTARELKLVRRLAPRTNVPKVMATIDWMARAAEVTKTMQIKRLREELEEAETALAPDVTCSEALEDVLLRARARRKAPFQVE